MNKIFLIALISSFVLKACTEIKPCSRFSILGTAIGVLPNDSLYKIIEKDGVRSCQYLKDVRLFGALNSNGQIRNVYFVGVSHAELDSIIPLIKKCTKSDPAITTNQKRDIQIWNNTGCNERVEVKIIHNNASTKDDDTIVIIIRDTSVD